MGIINAKLRILDKVDNTSDKDKNVKYSSVSNTITEQKVLNTNIQKYIDDSTNIHKSSLTEELNVYRFFSIQSDNTADPDAYSKTHDLPAVDNHTMVFSIDGGNEFNRIIDLDVRSSNIYTRFKGGGEWHPWIKLLDSNNYTDYAATKDHTHDYIPLSGTKSLTGHIVPTTWCTINLGSSDYPFSAIHCWQGVFVDPTKGSGDTSYIQIIGTPMENKKCGIVFGLKSKQKQVLLTPPSQVDLSDNPEVTLPNASGTIARLEDINKKITDWNTVIESGFYYSSAGASNAPVSNVGITGNVFAIGNMIVQTVYPESTDSMELVSYTRKGIYNSGTIWSKWIKHSTILKTITIKGYNASTYNNLFTGLIPDTATSLYFTDIKMPSNATLINVDEDGDNGVVAWLDTNDNTKMYVSTQHSGIKVEGNNNSSMMFYNCSKLTSIDVSNFDTSNVTDMNNMFYKCSKLTTLDLSNFDTSNVTSMSGMFDNCSKLTTIIVGDKFKWINKLSNLRLSGTWKDETGKQYTSDSTFPSNVAHTYTKVS